MTKTTEFVGIVYTTNHHGKQDTLQGGIAIISWQMRMDAALNTRTERNVQTLKARGKEEMNINRATHIARHNLCVEVGISRAVPSRKTHKWLEFWKIIVEALEKQKPKKPNLWGDGYADGYLVYDTWECPGCGKNYELEYEEYDHCPNCGQKLDWRWKEDET